MYPVQPGAFLSADFLSQFEGKVPKNKGLLFEVVYLRTYSRWRDDVRRRETWLETVQRVVEYSMSLAGTPKDEPSRHELCWEARELFQRIFDLKLFPSGRALWIGGTDAVKKHSESAFNCSYLPIIELESFCELFHLLMCGCGVGFSVLPDEISGLPQFYSTGVIHDMYSPVTKDKRKDKTVAKMSDNQITIYVGDSKEGWVEALRLFLDAYSDPNIHHIHFNYDWVRPEGERIKTFGGKAPGPAGIQQMFDKVGDVLNNLPNGRVGAREVTDICNLIAKNVIVGGNRRSSQIALGSPDDQDFMDMKKPENLSKNTHRIMSNNSIVFTSKPSLAKLTDVFENIHINGEPGFINLEAGRKRHPRMRGLNPCAEALCEPWEFCNLSVAVVTSHIKDGDIDFEDLMRSVELVSRIGVRQTNVTVSLKRFDQVQKKNRLIGVSMTGWMDALDSIGIDFDSEYAQHLLAQMNRKANEAATILSSQMGLPRPLLVTVVKPEGTLSQLPTVSSGLHRSYAPYFIRRIRVSKMDAVADALIEKGIPYVVDPNKSERLVFEFPIKTAAKIAANDEPALDQLRRYLIFQKCYTDHNSSTTITIDREETDEIVKMVHTEWDNIVGVAWLPKTPGSYPLMPYEAITKEEYEGRAANLQSLDDLHILVNKIENSEYEGDLDFEACTTGGQCPIR